MGEGSSDHSGANESDLLAGHEAAAFLLFLGAPRTGARVGGALDREAKTGNRPSGPQSLLNE
jgi:hypothetical protein